MVRRVCGSWSAHVERIGASVLCSSRRVLRAWHGVRKGGPERVPDEHREAPTSSRKKNLEESP